MDDHPTRSVEAQGHFHYFCSLYFVLLCSSLVSGLWCLVNYANIEYVRMSQEAKAKGENQLACDCGLWCKFEYEQRVRVPFIFNYITSIIIQLLFVLGACLERVRVKFNLQSTANF